MQRLDQTQYVRLSASLIGKIRTTFLNDGVLAPRKFGPRMNETEALLDGA
jgi:hypothetical protein